MIARLLCRLWRHDWRPSGLHYRTCVRCHDDQRILR